MTITTSESSPPRNYFVAPPLEFLTLWRPYWHIEQLFTEWIVISPSQIPIIASFDGCFIKSGNIWTISLQYSCNVILTACSHSPFSEYPPIFFVAVLTNPFYPHPLRAQVPPLLSAAPIFSSLESSYWKSIFLIFFQTFDNGIQPANHFWRIMHPLH